MKIEYQIVVRDGTLDLSKDVNELLSEGWKLQGGVSISHVYKNGDYDGICCQTMYREVE